MNCGPFQLRRRAGPTLLFLCGSLLSGAHAGERGRPIEFSQPKNDSTNTNAIPLGDNRNALRQLEEDLSTPPRMLDLQSSLDAVLPTPAPPPAAPAVRSKRIRELLERRKNWMFASPEDEFRDLTSDGPLGLSELGPDGKEKKSGSLLERYYEGLVRERAGTPNRSGESRLLLGEEPDQMEGDLSGNPDSNPVRAQLKDAERSLRALFDSRPAGSSGLDESTSLILPDLTGTRNTIPLYQQKAQEARQDQFRQMLQSPSLAPAPAAPGLGSFTTPFTTPKPAGDWAGAGAAASRSASVPTGLSPGGWAVAPPISLSAGPTLTPALPPASQPIRPSASPFMELPKRRF